MRTVEMTEQEWNGLAKLLDLVLRGHGLGVAKAVMHYMEKISPPEMTQENPEGK